VVERVVELPDLREDTGGVKRELGVNEALLLEAITVDGVLELVEHLEGGLSVAVEVVSSSEPDKVLASGLVAREIVGAIVHKARVVADLDLHVAKVAEDVPIVWLAGDGLLIAFNGAEVLLFKAVYEAEHVPAHV
jgi:hypothetical protein